MKVKIEGLPQHGTTLSSLLYCQRRKSVRYLIQLDGIFSHVDHDKDETTTRCAKIDPSHLVTQSGAKNINILGPEACPGPPMEDLEYAAPARSLCGYDFVEGQVPLGRCMH